MRAVDYSFPRAKEVLFEDRPILERDCVCVRVCVRFLCGHNFSKVSLKTFQVWKEIESVYVRVDEVSLWPQLLQASPAMCYPSCTIMPYSWVAKAPQVLNAYTVFI